MNLNIEFQYPWLYFLLIPAFAIALWPYFRLDRKYRRTRNRIISLVLHLCIMFLCVNVLTGVAFAYDTPITENELIVVVDVSYSNREVQEDKNKFIDTLLTNKDSSFKIGIVTFGGEPKYVAPLSNNIEEVRNAYHASLNDELPNLDSATNISKALFKAAENFSNPRAAKILLISDGLETDIRHDNKDISAISAITTISNMGIIVDTVYFGNDYGNEVQIMDVIMPDHNVVAGSKVTLTAIVNSTFNTSIDITVYDNGIESSNGIYDIKEGQPNAIFIDHIFEELGSHQMYFKIQSIGDTIQFNNQYYSYVNLKTFDSILIITKEGQAQMLNDLMRQETNFFNYSNVPTVADIYNEAPTTLEELSLYDQVILINIANRDMPDGFIELLDEYVRVLGGGLLTVGGDRADGKSNVYTREEMYVDSGTVLEQPTLYQQMLPIECNDYFPPVAVMLALDVSGSMVMNVDPNTGDTPLKVAKDAIVAIARDDYLNPRDYLGVVSFSSAANNVYPLGPLPAYNRIENALEPLRGLGGTNWGAAIERSLLGFGKNSISRKHIVLVTDGEPDPSINEVWNDSLRPMVERCVRNKITLSIVTIGAGASITAATTKTIDYFNNFWNSYYNDENNLAKGIKLSVRNASDLKETLKVLFGSDYIKDQDGPFTPVVGDRTSVLNNVNVSDMPTLNGFYGVKRKEGDESIKVPLMGEFTPIYAQWNYGKGKVGSLMVDLVGKWSGELMTTDTGKLLLDNIINGLFPSEPIIKPEIDATISRTNYELKVAVNSRYNVGETFKISIKYDTVDHEVVDLVVPEPDLSSGRPTVSVRLPYLGVYEITILKMSASGQIISDEHIMHTTFSYSDEYNAFPTKDGKATLEQLAKINDGGSVITTDFIRDDNGNIIDDNTNYAGVFDGIPDSISKVWNPRLHMIILVLIMFLLDIAVRKFKFRWPWEIYRDSKAKQQLGAQPKRTP